MDLEQVLQELCIPEAYSVFSPHWDESVSDLPGSDIPFLDSATLREYREWSSLDSTTEGSLLQVAQRIKANPALCALAWHCYRLMYLYPDYNEMSHWPMLTQALDDQAGVFYLIIALGMVPLVRSRHQSMGVAENISRDTCRQIACFTSNYVRATDGKLGIPLNQIYWLRHYTAGRLFRIGRMEYMLRPFAGAVQVYRQKGTGRIVALSADGVRFNHEGYVDGTGGVVASQGWTATLTISNSTVTGFPVSPWGYALPQQIALCTNEWECVLHKGDITLDMHIPAGGGMLPEKCIASMREAVPFFQQLFPDQPFRAITCSSWIFNTQLAELQLSSDNLARYQQELYLFPVRSTGQDGLWFIFLQNSFDLSTVPRHTSLQRAVADYLSAGHTWRGGGMFFLTEHIDLLGSQYYRRTWNSDVVLNHKIG